MAQFKQAQAGTLESGDIVITIMPCVAGEGLTIEVQSIVIDQYGEQIRQTIAETVQACGISDAVIKAVDRGALEHTVRARVLTALVRGGVVLREEE